MIPLHSPLRSLPGLETSKMSEGKGGGGGGVGGRSRRRRSERGGVLTHCSKRNQVTVM